MKVPRIYPFTCTIDEEKLGGKRTRGRDSNERHYFHINIFGTFREFIKSHARSILECSVALSMTGLTGREGGRDVRRGKRMML